MASFSVTYQAYVNQPPTIGNYTMSKANREGATIGTTLTTAMFTTSTTPAYSDIEGDSADAVRINTLPTNGAVLKLDGVIVTVGQTITIADITSGKLKLVAPDVNALTTSVFTFSVRDTGSMVFSS